MSLKWIGCLAALAASVGLAAAHDPVGDPGPAPGSPVVAPQEQTFGPSMEPAAFGESLYDPTGDGDACYWLRAHADYLLWSLKRDYVQTLVGSLPPALAGVNPLPPGSIIPVFGGDHDSLNYRGQSGVRIGLEGWFDAEQHIGMDVELFQLAPGSVNTALQSSPNGLPILGPTFNDPVAGAQHILLFSEPGLSTSAFAVSSESRLEGLEANFRTRVPATFNDHTEFLVGFRTVQFNQDLNVAGSGAVDPGLDLRFNSNPNAESFRYFDSFSVHDQFYGPQIGFDSESTYKCFFLNLKAKVALGMMDETVRISGATNFLTPANFTVPGGVLAQPTNIGSHHHDLCTFVPEFAVNAGVMLGRYTRAFVGYDFLYIDQMQRVGSTIDGVDATQVPVSQANPNVKAARPGFQFDEGRFWAQGLTAGLEFRY